jgi:gliding motility-associated-like protein
MSSKTKFPRKWLFLLPVCLFFINSSWAQLTAAFNATPTAGCVPLLARFQDQSSGNPSSWRWDLGNGTISTLQNPSATYFTPGKYTIKLVVKNAFQADSVVKTQYITVHALPTVNFQASDSTGCFPLSIGFTDLSSPGDGTIISWEWDFGDGTTSTLPNPVHVYSSAGNFSVTLRVKNSFGCTKTFTKTNYIKINNGVTADFSITSSNSCAYPVNIPFVNASTGTGTLSYQWSFGDGGTSTLQNPTHTYNNAGSYTIQLIVTNNTGCSDTLTKPNGIVLGTVGAGFTSPATICAGQPLNLVNTSSPTPSGALWTFGDGTSSTLITPFKAYSTGGNYTIKLVSNFGACKDSVEKPIQVLDRPTADFTSSYAKSCRAPHTVAFTANFTGGTSYQWFFGDGSSSTDPNPVHTYTSNGNFTVSLQVINAAGCNATLVKPGFVQIMPPQITIENLPRRGCAPLLVAPSLTVTSVDPIAAYEWNFGDGTISNLVAPTHVYTATGSYTISLIVTTIGGCRDTVTIPNAAVVSPKPVAAFTATPRDACAFTDIQFTDQSTGLITNWLWFYGDGGASIEQNPVYQYNDTGYFHVTLIVSNNGCSDTLQLNDFIHIKPPIAKFKDSLNCGQPFSRFFTDQSIGATSWLWDFGDGTTSTAQNPVKVYTTKGVFTVKLFVSNGTCNHQTTKPVTIIEEKADFQVSDTIICKGTSISFQSRNINPANISSFTWNFGDSTIVTGNLPTTAHVYTKAGIYTVKLLITDLNGCKDSMIKPLHIQVDGPTAKFTPSVPGSCLNSAITFTDQSTDDGIHPIQQWIWNYGDGVTETLTAPPFTHTYSAPNIYNVTLTVVDSKGCRDVLVQNSLLTISKPVALFNSLDTNTCPLRPVKFTNLSTGPGLTYTWDFGDGSSSTDANPSHSYLTEGQFTIKLYIRDQYGCTDSSTKNTYITVLTPRARFKISDSVSTCPPLIVNFTNESINYTSYTWYFGDGSSSDKPNPTHYYSSAGTYFAKLVIAGPGTCKDSMVRKIVIRGPQGDFSYTNLIGCTPLTVNFKATTKDNATFVWDFNDGTVLTNTDSVLTHTFTNPGVYVPKMILVDPQGCQVPIVGLDTIRVLGVDAKFGLSKTVLCDSGFVTFRDSSVSNDPITNYDWSFGDGSTSNSQNPVHGYNTTGNYNIQLIITTQNGCKDTAKVNAPLKIVKSPLIGISGDTSACVPANVQFAGQLLRADTSALSWQWNFGNGQTSTTQNPASMVYSTAGSYPIGLIATNSSGCADTSARLLVVHPKPVIDAGIDTLVCKGSGVTLTATGGNSYTWSPANLLSCANCATPFAKPDSVQLFKVTGSSIFNCKADDSVLVKVKFPFVMRTGPGDTLCKGESATLVASNAYSYNWTPTTGLSNPKSGTTVARPDVPTTYMVVGTDDRNCFTDTGYVKVQVYPIPTVEAGTDKTVSVGTSVQLNSVISSDVASIRWIPAVNLSCSTCPNPIATPRQDATYTIKVTNKGGCSAQDLLRIFVTCENGNLFVPNTFSPNRDGANDVFYPRGKGLHGVKSLRVFNRWGEIVFEKLNFQANDIGAGWDGRYKNMDASPDVYIYTIEVICTNNTVLSFKGNIALIR